MLCRSQRAQSKGVVRARLTLRRRQRRMSARRVSSQLTLPSTVSRHHHHGDVMAKPTRRAIHLLAGLAVLLLTSACSTFGPTALQESRLRYNEVVKTTTEEQLLLNIVRLRYTDTPSSLAISAIAAQFEVNRNF